MQKKASGKNLCQYVAIENKSLESAPYPCKMKINLLQFSDVFFNSKYLRDILCYL